MTNKTLIHQCFADIDAYEPPPNKRWNQNHSSLYACYTVKGELSSHIVSGWSVS